MDRRERGADLNDVIIMVMQGMQAYVWTALPAIITSYNATAMTVSCRPAIQAKVQNKDGTYEWATLPELLDCPVCFQGGGGYTLTFPVQAGDEALIVFSSRCIDAWWQSGGIQQQSELRMHDLSDGFAIVGIRSQPRRISCSTSACELRNDSGSVIISLDGSSVDIAAPTVAITAGTTTVNGDMIVNGNIEQPNPSNSLTIAGSDYKDHRHIGVRSGGDTSGVVA